jgi:hypothetical protein
MTYFFRGVATAHGKMNDMDTNECKVKKKKNRKVDYGPGFIFIQRMGFHYTTNKQINK